MSIATDGAPILDAAGFRHWFDSAASGDSLIYHRGDLGRDRVINGLHAVANAALKLCDAGRLYLFQKRLDEGCFAYIAIKAAPAPMRNASTDRRRIENRAA